MHLSFIGMSGTGKSHWSKKLAEHGFVRFCCDDLIGQKLKTELPEATGILAAMGQWMGFPYDPQYLKAEAKYLSYEADVLQELFDFLENGKDVPEKLIIDTTGSVLYTEKKYLNLLSQYTTIIHLATPLEIQEKMCEKYQEKPRPLIWKDCFSQSPGESNEEALIRCYHDLLSSREEEYPKLSHVSIGYYERRAKGFEAKDFLKVVAEGRKSLDF